MNAATIRPPGVSTRADSRTAPAASSMSWSDMKATTRSNVASSNGSAAASPTITRS